MEIVKGQVVSVVRSVLGATVAVDAVATATVLTLDDVSAFNDEGGSVEIDGQVYAYAADSIDHTAYTLTLSTGLLAPVTHDDTFVAVSPQAPVHTAFVLQNDDVNGDPIPARIPQWARAQMPEGIREPDMREAATLTHDGAEWTLNDIEFRSPPHDATTTPIVVTTPDGESVRLDGDGLTARTNDLVMFLRNFAGNGSDPIVHAAAADGLLFKTDPVSFDIRKYDITTGDEDVTAFPVVGTFSALAAAGGYVYAIDASADIRKYDAETGAQIVSGFPIAGTFGSGAQGGLAADATAVYAIDDPSDDIKKYDAATGGLLYTITGTFKALAVSDGFIYAIDGSDDIRKYDTATGTEDTTAFPVTGSFNRVAADSGFVYGQDIGGLQIHQYDAETAVEVTSFSMVNATSDFVYAMAASDGYLFVGFDTSHIRMYSTGATSEISAQIESSSGLVRALQLEVYTTKARLTSTESTSSGSTHGVGNYGAFDGVLPNESPFWRYQAGIFTIEVAGVYDLNAFVKWAANATNLRLAYIVVNSTGVAEDARNAVNSVSTETAQSISATVALSVGDQVFLQVLQNSGGPLNVSAGSYLSITRRGSLAA